MVTKVRTEARYSAEKVNLLTLRIKQPIVDGPEVQVYA